MTKQKPQPRSESRQFIPKRYHHLISVGIILLALIVFFRDAIFQ